MGGEGVDSIQLAPYKGSCGHDNEHSGSIKAAKLSTG